MFLKSAIAVISFLLFTICLYSVFITFMTNDGRVYDENGLLESLQVIVLMLTTLMFAIGVIKNQGKKLVFGFFTVLCLGFILREVDFEKIDMPAALIFISSGAGRNTLLLMCFIGIGLYATLHFEYYRRIGAVFLRSKTMATIITSGVLLIISSGFESASFQHAMFVEELLELIAYSVLLIASMMFLIESHSFTRGMSENTKNNTDS